MFKTRNISIDQELGGIPLQNGTIDSAYYVSSRMEDFIIDSRLVIKTSKQ